MNNNRRVHKFIQSVTIIIVAMSVISSFLLTFAITRQCETYMLEEASALIAADATQLQLNINTYMDRIEDNVALMFSDEEYYGYDRTTTTLEEYDRIQIENKIAERIIDLGALENYGDFCVVYADDNTVGWKSKTTGNMYGDVSIYQDLSQYIINNRTLDGWAYGVQNNFERMYYVKRYNENAIILASFYTRELEKVFKYPEELQGMKVRLVDSAGSIVYSSDKDELGQSIGDSERQYLAAGANVNAITDTEIIDVGFCENGWMVMCTVPRSVIMSGIDEMRTFAYLISIFVVLIVVILCYLVLRQLSKPMDGYVDQLSEAATVDALSNVYNRAAFEDEVTTSLEQGAFEQAAFIMCDVDHFKKVNDTMGHDHGDEVIKQMGAFLADTFVNKDNVQALVGRLGGDEFAIFLKYSEQSDVEELKNQLNDVLISFKECFAEERKTIPLSMSIGVALHSDVSANISYRELYKAADEALYIAKGNGKDQYRFYQGGMNNEA